MPEITDAQVEAAAKAIFDANDTISSRWSMILARAALEAAAGVGEREVVLSLHHKRPELMVDEESTIDDVSADDVTVEVMVCDHCFHLAYPDGSFDDYCDPEVMWPCATAKLAGEGVTSVQRFQQN